MLNVPHQNWLPLLRSSPRKCFALNSKSVKLSYSDSRKIPGWVFDIWKVILLFWKLIWNIFLSQLRIKETDIRLTNKSIDWFLYEKNIGS